MCISNRQNDGFKLMILNVGVQNLELSQAVNKENINWYNVHWGQCDNAFFKIILKPFNSVTQNPKIYARWIGADACIEYNQYKVVYLDAIWIKNSSWNQHKWQEIDTLLSELESMHFNMKNVWNIFNDVEEMVVEWHYIVYKAICTAQVQFCAKINIILRKESGK